MTDNVRTWRVVIQVDFPKREPPMIDEHGKPGLPPKLEFGSFIESQTRTIDGIRLGLRPYGGPALPVEITGSLGLQREIGEMAFVLSAPSANDALSAVAPLAEAVIEDLSFQLQYAIRPISASVIDVTEPVSPGETREMMQMVGFPLAKFLQSAALGHIEVQEQAVLLKAKLEVHPRVEAARGWYVKALSTPFQADQFIFLWIALETLWAKSDYKTLGPITCPKGHEIKECPVCEAPTEKPVFGLGIRRFLVEVCSLDDDEASQLWRTRQIMHGAVSFDSEEMTEIPKLVLVLRAAVARLLKAEAGFGDHDLPRVVPGVLSIHPQSIGVGGTSVIEDSDLGWP